MSTFAYVNDFKASGALGLNKHIDVQSVEVFADISAHELGSYSMLPYRQHL